MESFSDGDDAARELIDEVYGYLMGKRYPTPLIQCTEGRKRIKKGSEVWGVILQEEAERQGQLSMKRIKSEDIIVHAACLKSQGWT